MAHPGVVKVTTDEDKGGSAYTFRHVMITNIPWLVQLTQDSPKAATMATLSWDWAKQPVEVPVYGNQYKDRVVSLFTQFQ
jgi:hypothetical protein